MELVMIYLQQLEDRAIVIYLRLLAEHADAALEREMFHRSLPRQPIERRRRALAAARESGVAPFHEAAGSFRRG
jgi:hypothetical protein